MSGSRKSLQRAAQTFNPRAENSWSKDDSKFGQRMLEKMGWKKGEGIGRDGQGVKENIKIRWKLDSKGLGFSIKEDEWVAVEHDFSKLLSNLSNDCTKKSTRKLSLESTSSSSRSRVHYRKFIRGKDISKYSKKDLSGILGRNAINNDDDGENEDHKMDDSSSTRMNLSLEDERSSNLLEIDDSSSNKKMKKRKSKRFGDHLRVINDDTENCNINSETMNDAENIETNEPLAKELRDSNVAVERSKTEDLSKSSKKKSSRKKLESNPASSIESVDTDVSVSLKTDDSVTTKKVKKRKLNLESTNNDSFSTKKVKKRKLNLELRDNAENGVADELDSSVLNSFNISSETDNLPPPKKAKKKKLKQNSDVNQILLVNEDEQDEKSVEHDLEIDSSAPIGKRKKKSVIDSNSESVINGACEDENQSSLLVELENTPAQCSSFQRKRRKDVADSSIDDFDCFMRQVAEFNSSTDPKAVIEEFEKNKEALLKRYRESYLRNYLDSANENDCRIYSNLNGDELDCENNADEGDCEINVSKKKKQPKHVRTRPLTKAERIILKARLLKTIQNESCSHCFAGSNLNDIVGYGNETVSS